jgi:prepilin-type N-terminal cleavage/methylation domain-containing protein
MRRARRSSEGFSLLELLIVVAIILVIATIAIPSLIRSRQMANETSAVANLRTISNAEATYLSSSGGSYGDLTQLVSDRLLDDRFATGGYGGYHYAITASSFAFTATATPISLNSGRYGYYMLPDSVIRYSTTVNLAPLGRAGYAVR